MPPDACSAINLAKGGHAFRQGDPARGLFAVVNGLIELRRITEEGVPVAIHKAGKGETFAEASLFSELYHCDAVAVEPSEIIMIKRSHVLELFGTDSAFAIALARRFAGQIQNYRRRIEILAIRNARERVYAGLTEGLMNTDIKGYASEIGLTHEAVYRALAVLVSEGRILKTGRGRYRLASDSRDTGN
jgi:CRP/FNR family transcriptional regulator, dissimilatory nitrate respiration regulator